MANLVRPYQFKAAMGNSDNSISLYTTQNRMGACIMAVVKEISFIIDPVAGGGGLFNDAVIRLILIWVIPHANNCGNPKWQ